MTDLSGVHNYTYDSIYQLTQATHPAMPTEQFSYDSVGNRISAEREAVGTPVATNYTYDSENRLTKVEYPGMVAQYKYDPFGRRIEKNVNGDITRYLYDGPNIVTEYNGAWNVKAKYASTLDVDDPLTVTQEANTFYYHKDALGSVVNLTDASGNVAKSYTYKSFGEVYQESGSLVQPYTFTSREYDSESGLYYYRARYYDAKAGRFLTKDPIGFAAGDVNLYRYVQNNPIKFLDPSGLICFMSQSTGRVVCWNNALGEPYLDTSGYSGTGTGRNNPDMQNVPNVGPIPRGCWIVGAPENRPNSTGEYSLPLTPFPSNEVFGTFRNPNTFVIHGEIRDPARRGDASTGCPVLQRSDRQKIPEGEVFCVAQ